MSPGLFDTFFSLEGQYGKQKESYYGHLFPSV